MLISGGQKTTEEKRLTGHYRKRQTDRAWPVQPEQFIRGREERK
jgi:hypothetical protein